MQKPWSIKLTFLLVILSLMLMVSCGKKTVQTDLAGDETAKAEMTQEEKAAADAAKAAEAISIEEEAIIAEEALKAEADLKVREAVAMAKEEFQSSDIYFDYDSSTILDSEISELETKAEWLKNNPEASVTIEGHCDSRGTTEYNIALGDRRAARVKAFFMELGIGERQLNTVSYGEEKPVDTGYNEASWARNRRAHFQIN